MRRALAAFLAFLLLFGCVPAYAAVSGVCGDALTWTYGDGVLIIEGTGPMYEYGNSSDVPWYRYRGKIERVEVREGVTSVCADAFMNFALLDDPEDVSFPETLTQIGSNVFKGTKLLENASPALYIGDHLVAVKDKDVFEVREGTLTIAVRAFDGCSKLGRVTLPASLRNINANAFAGAKNLSQVRYGADEAAWSAIAIDGGNENLTNAAITYTPVHRHEYLPVAVEGYCDEGRVTTYACACGERKTERGEPAEHVSEAVGKKEPTCTEQGFTEGSVCRVCGKVLTAQELIPPKGHSAETLPGCPPTCTADGLTDGEICSVCGKVLTAQTVIPAAHTPVEMPESAPTCTEPGHTAYVKCAVCGELIKPPAPIDAAGHDFGAWETTLAPTCVTPGVKSRVCARCGGIEQETIPTDPELHTGILVRRNEVPASCGVNGYSGDMYCADCGALRLTGHETPALLHDFDPAVTVLTAPTCAVEGRGTQVCRNCGLVIEVTIPVTKTHTGPEIIQGEKAATCTVPGFTGDTYCAECGKKLSDGETVPAAGHAPVRVPGAAPTCTEPGFSEGSVCAVCGLTLEARTVLPATGHIETILPGSAPTCTESGLSEGSVCSACGLMLKSQTVLPAAGHVETILPGVAPACTEPGLSEGSVCAVCGLTLKAQEVLPAAGHVETVLPGFPATCTAPGRADGTVCSRCGLILTPGEPIPRTDHVWSDPVTTRPAQIGVAGEQTRVCLTCGARETLPVDPLPAETTAPPSTQPPATDPDPTTAAPIDPTTEPMTNPVSTEPTTALPAESTTDPATEPPTKQPTTGPSTEPSTNETTTKPLTTEPPAIPFLLGDVDFDGRVLAKDARLALRLSARLEVVRTTAQFAAADVDGDGHILAKDARRILRVSARLESFS